MSVHGVNAQWQAVTHVQETACGKIVWEGEVETFALINHPTAKFCYAWSLEAGDMIVVLTALKIPPVGSPRAAIQTAYKEGKLDANRHLLKK
jgi:hypothetical protein